MDPAGNDSTKNKGSPAFLDLPSGLALTSPLKGETHPTASG